MVEISNDDVEQIVDNFREDNTQDGLRVFVAGGSRAGNTPIFTKEAYNLGKQIAQMEFKLDFGLSNAGIMGAVARGVLDGWNKLKYKQSPIKGITTKEYFDLYEKDELLSQIEDVIMAKTLEERKQKLLDSDFIVFAPGGVGTLDELAYNCVAIQDGFLQIKPFILYNVDGFFHHLVEYLKSIALTGFADPIPFIIVDDSVELGTVFSLLKLRYEKRETMSDVYGATRQLIYELPYFLKRKAHTKKEVQAIIDEMKNISLTGNAKERQDLADEIEQAYLEKETERMFDRLAKAGKDTSLVSEKLTDLRNRQKTTKK